MNSVPSLTSPRTTMATACRGFSLLEMVVAISVLSLALAMLYQASSGATRNVRSDEKYAYGVELARSLLAEHDVVLASGVDKGGETEGGFKWQVVTAPVALGAGGSSDLGLQQIEVVVSWRDGLRERRIVLDSVVGSGGA